MPHLRTGVRGDLHAHVEVMVPTRLDHRDADLLREFKNRRHGDAAQVKPARAADGGGLFSRLRETFTGR
jgi:molecular chaperone DnaJ